MVASYVATKCSPYDFKAIFFLKTGIHNTKQTEALCLKAYITKLIGTKVVK